MGEKKINDEDCFILKLEAEPSTLKARSSSNVEIIRHTVWGCFSQRTGLLIQLEDSHLLRIKAQDDNSIFWETTMESLIQDYRIIDGVQVAHAGKSSVSLFRFGENSDNHSRTRMEETWEIEEMDFNIKGLCMDCFLPPSDLKKDDDEEEEEEEEVEVECGLAANNEKLPMKIRSASLRISSSKVLAIVEEEDESDVTEEMEET
ncbi:hypothetical protein Bca52824_096835 [Brassica carinata]|nr:hypothetical protein Bca52824_096835 [Brassica carinata]